MSFGLGIGSWRREICRPLDARALVICCRSDEILNVGRGTGAACVIAPRRDTSMPVRTFMRPAPWGIGPGPAHLYSVDGAISAVDLWLELTPAHVSIRRERELMLALRDLLGKVPQGASHADLQAARRAIAGMVKYARSREAQGARITSYMLPRQVA
jgi:hypothetical protein